VVFIEGWRLSLVRPKSRATSRIVERLGFLFEISSLKEQYWSKHFYKQLIFDIQKNSIDLGLWE